MKHCMTAAILCALLLSAVSCGSAAGTEPAGSAGTEPVIAETETEGPSIPEPDLPEMDFGGADFTYLIHGESAPSYKEEYVYAEKLDGEIVNDTIYNRNIQIEEKFNIKIRIIDEAETANAAKKFVESQDATVDVVDTQANTLGPLATSGYLYDFNDLKYVNTAAEYWNPYAAQDLAVLGRLYFMPADISMRGLQSARFIYFNKKLIENYDLDDPYRMVQENKWTLDKFLSYIPEITEDLNGDGIYDRNDLFGMLIEDGNSNGTFLHLLTGCGVQYTEADKDGRIVVTAMTEKTQDILTKISDAIKDKDYTIEYNQLAKGADISGFDHLYDWARSRFAAGQFLFVQNGINEMRCFRDMTDDFGIVPNPKYDASQENYYHKSDAFSPLFTIPVSVGNVDRADAVLEYSAWLSHETLLPAYYEVTIKQKRVRDETAVAMLDIIRTSVRYEVSQIYDIGISDALWSAWQKGELASTFAKKEKSINKSIEKLLTQVEALDG